MTHSRVAWAGVLFIAVYGAVVSAGEAGRNAFSELQIPWNAREMATGGASRAISSGLYGVGSNPAAGAFEQKRQAFAGYRSVMLDVWGGSAGFGMPVADAGFFSARLLNVSGGSLDEIDDAGEITGVRWRANTFSGSLSWGRLVYPGLAAGLTFRGVYDYMAGGAETYDASALMFDAGLQYRVLRDRLILGGVVSNIGGMVTTWDRGDSYPLPLSAAAGLSFVPRYIASLRIALDVEKTRGEHLAFEPGIALSMADDVLMIRAGFPFSVRELKELFARMSGEGTPGYRKQNWRLLCLGVGVLTELGGAGVGFDVAIEFRADIDPAVGASVHVSF